MCIGSNYEKTDLYQFGNKFGKKPLLPNHAHPYHPPTVTTTTFETHNQSQTTTHNHCRNQINHLYHNKIRSTHNKKPQKKKKKNTRPMKQSDVIAVATPPLKPITNHKPQHTTIVKIKSTTSTTTKLDQPTTQP